MYKRFAGEAEPADANAAAIAGKIREHLHEREYRIHPGRPDKGRGRITARAASIVQSAPPHLPDEGRCWSPQDEKDYEKAGNVAADIRARAEKLEKEARGRNRFSVRDAAPILYEQYGRLFRDGNGKALRVPEARKEYPGMFALHCAVKDAYARILENHRLGNDEIRKATGERFDASAYAAKLPLLFGDRKDLFESEDEAFGKSVLRFALNGWAKLRHSSFHFKGLGEFARILDLYIEMHDAKFEGGEGMAGAQALKGLFEPEGTFDRVCPTQTDEDRRRYVPWRGLREILRFGCLAWASGAAFRWEPAPIL